MKIKKEAVIDAVRRQGDGGMEFRDLMRLFGIDKARRLRFKEFVDGLVADGELVKLKGNRLTLPVPGDTFFGRLGVHRDGYGFVAPDDGGDDVFIPARFLGGNLHGDRVEVRVTARKYGGKREGRIVRIVERGVKRIVGRFQAGRQGGVVIPDDRRIGRDIRVESAGGTVAASGQVVVAEVTAYPTDHLPPQGKLIEVLGWPGEPETELLAIVRRFDLPYEFPPPVIAAAAAMSMELTPAELAGRTDLRHETTVTIDGETARDFDDAVAVRREAGGRIRLRVSIADVSHYVAEGAPLDLEALRRGTSVYFPDRCIPMLPEALSNELCSLKPGVERLTMTAELLVDPAGRVEAASFFPSVIRSAARLTYTLVRRILVDRDAEALAAHAGLVPDLQLMEELARRLMAKREERGSIDFDLPEPEIILDLQGAVQDIVRAERNLAHRIIEECMLAANEAVARFLEKAGIPSLYRVHEPPDPEKLTDFREFVRGFGHDFRMDEQGVLPGEFRRILVAIEGRPEERLINQVLLRCMKQARYAAENLGHFGLAATCYTHFTSPIRRYPDLVVHRLLKGVLAGSLTAETSGRLEQLLPEIAHETSRRERVAMEAEREIVLLKKLQFMANRVGEEFDAFINGVTPFGFFVELVDLFVEGMVHISTLPADFYRFAEKQHLLQGDRTRATYRLGDRVRVRVANVSLERKTIDFVLVTVIAAEHGVAAIAEEYPRIPVTGKQVRRKPAEGGKHGGSGAGRPGAKSSGRKGGGPRRRR